MIVLDTTVLVYAKGVEHPLRDPCRDIVRGIEDGIVSATTTTEVIQEFAHVRARRRDRGDAASLAASFVDLLAPLLLVEEPHLRQALRLFEQYPELGSFDAVLAAATLASGAEGLLSADRTFSVVSEIVHLEPGTPAVERLLGR